MMRASHEFLSNKMHSIVSCLQKERSTDSTRMNSVLHKEGSSYCTGQDFRLVHKENCSCRGSELNRPRLYIPGSSPRTRNNTTSATVKSCSRGKDMASRGTWAYMYKQILIFSFNECIHGGRRGGSPKRLHKAPTDNTKSQQ